jgi:hypothetical protein
MRRHKTSQTAHTANFFHFHQIAYYPQAKNVTDPRGEAISRSCAGTAGKSNAILKE